MVESHHYTEVRGESRSTEWLEGYRAGYNDHARARRLTYVIYGIGNGENMESLFDIPSQVETAKVHACAGEDCRVCHPDTNPKAIARRRDPATSKAAAKAVAYRTGTQKARLLIQYRTHGPLTDEEASDHALLPAGWKRCSDLRNEGMIEPDGTTRKSRMSQMAQMVCAITDKGMATLASMKETHDSAPAAHDRPACPECGTTSCSRRPGYPYCYGGAR